MWYLIFIIIVLISSIITSLYFGYLFLFRIDKLKKICDRANRTITTIDEKAFSVRHGIGIILIVIGIMLTFFVIAAWQIFKYKGF